MRPLIIGVAHSLLAVSMVASAQTPADLVITNARIVAGIGDVIDRGSIVVRDGRIVEVVGGLTDSTAEVQVDAVGLTLLPGLIDTHRHILVNPSTLSADTDEALARWMQTELAPALLGYLQSGVTTVMSVGDFVPAIFDVRRQLESGQLQGPRLLLTGPIFTARDGHPPATVCAENPWCRTHAAVEVDDPELARQRVRELAAAGVDAIKATYERQQQPIRLGDDVLLAIGQEADRHGLPLVVHAEGINAVELGADRLVHPPLGVENAEAAGAILKEKGIPIATTLGLVGPWVVDGQRTLTPWGVDFDEALLDEELDRVRRLWDSGVTVAFGTDTPLAAGDALALEVDLLSRVFSPGEIVRALTVNAAEHLGLRSEIGTLAEGKVADMLLVDGDPLTDAADLANVVLVVQQGAVVVDNR